MCRDKHLRSYENSTNVLLLVGIGDLVFWSVRVSKMAGGHNHQHQGTSTGSWRAGACRSILRDRKS